MNTCMYMSMCVKQSQVVIRLYFLVNVMFATVDKMGFTRSILMEIIVLRVYFARLNISIVCSAKLITAYNVKRPIFVDCRFSSAYL